MEPDQHLSACLRLSQLALLTDLAESEDRDVNILTKNSENSEKNEELQPIQNVLDAHLRPILDLEGQDDAISLRASLQIPIFQEKIVHYSEALDSLSSLRQSQEMRNFKLVYFGDLHLMKVQLSSMIPRYLNDEEKLFKLTNLFDRIEEMEQQLMQLGLDQLDEGHWPNSTEDLQGEDSDSMNMERVQPSEFEKDEEQIPDDPEKVSSLTNISLLSFNSLLSRNVWFV